MRDVLQRLTAVCKSGGWLTRERIFAYSGILLGCEILVFLFFVAGTHGWIVPLDVPTTTDFASFYAAGDLANAGSPEAAYDHTLHFAAEERATQSGVGYVIFVYPPVFLLLCGLLARLPYLVAFVVFEVATLMPCALVLRHILREKAWAVLIPILAFPAVPINFGEGQNAFLTAALFGGATLLIDSSPVAAGVLIGALCYKPHFGLLLPVALLAGRRWPALASATATVALLILFSGLVFGWQAWRSFFIAFTESHSIYESGQVDFAAFISPFGALRLLGLPPPLAYIVQAAISLCAAAAVAFAWWRDLSLPTRAATLAAATLVALPLALFYDLMMAAVAIAWLVRGGREAGFRAWETPLLGAAFIAPALARGLGTSLHLPIAAIGSFVLFSIAVARARRESALREMGEPYVAFLPQSL